MYRREANLRSGGGHTSVHSDEGEERVGERQWLYTGSPIFSSRDSKTSWDRWVRLSKGYPSTVGVCLFRRRSGSKVWRRVLTKTSPTSWRSTMGPPKYYLWKRHIGVTLRDSPVDPESYSSLGVFGVVCGSEDLRGTTTKELWTLRRSQGPLKGEEKVSRLVYPTDEDGPRGSYDGKDSELTEIVPKFLGLTPQTHNGQNLIFFIHLRKP